MVFSVAAAFSSVRSRALQEATLKPGRESQEGVEASTKSLPFSRPGFPPLEQRLSTEQECKAFAIPNPEPAQGLAPGRCEAMQNE